jgi:hypothetical protein
MEGGGKEGGVEGVIYSIGKESPAMKRPDVWQR